MAVCACLLDEDAKASLRISQAIDRELSQHKKETAREFKLLLLGRLIRVHLHVVDKALGGAYIYMYKKCCGLFGGRDLCHSRWKKCYRRVS